MCSKEENRSNGLSGRHRRDNKQSKHDIRQKTWDEKPYHTPLSALWESGRDRAKKKKKKRATSAKHAFFHSLQGPQATAAIYAHVSGPRDNGRELDFGGAPFSVCVTIGNMMPDRAMWAEKGSCSLSVLSALTLCCSFVCHQRPGPSF